MKAIILMFILIPLAGLSQTAPGGVASNLQLWLKADSGVTGTTTVTQWDDQSPNSKNLDSYFGTPALETNSINFNPAMDFDGSSYLEDPDGEDFINGDTAGSWYFIIESESTDSDAGWMDLNLTSDDNGGMSIRYDKSGYKAGGTDIIKVGYSNEMSDKRVESESYVQFTVPQLVRYRLPTGELPEIALQGKVIGQTWDDGNVGSMVDQDFIRIGYHSKKNWNGLVAEAIYFDTSLSTIPQRKTETYLAVKYGITLDTSGGGANGDYLSADGTTIWDASNGSNYHNDVIGIGREDTAVLYQKQSKALDDSLIIYLDDLAVTNQLNTGTVTNDSSYIMIGHNRAKLQGIRTEKPATVYSRLSREWKVTNTNFTDTFNLEILWDSVGAFNLSDLRLLVDTDGNFFNAQIYGTSSGLTFSTGSIIVSGINTDHIPSNSTRYITIGSASSSTPLPIDLVSFEASLKEGTVYLDWTTFSEIDNEYFTVERSWDGFNWEELATINGAGNSSIILNYSSIDNNPYFGISYYRLKQTDYNGQFKYFGKKAVRNLEIRPQILIYPNPVTDLTIIESENAKLENIGIYNILGKSVISSVNCYREGVTKIVMDFSNLPQGLYFIKTETSVTPIYKQ